jgi:4-carboxymuconolactone decarboxylase
MDDEERAAQGMRVRRAVLGDAHVDRAVSNTTEFTAPFQDWITRYAWGEIWARPGLTRSQRSIVTLTVLAALQHEDELAMHTKAALRNGLTEDEIRRSCSRSASTRACPSPIARSRSPAPRFASTAPRNSHGSGCRLTRPRDLRPWGESTTRCPTCEHLYPDRCRRHVQMYRREHWRESKE